jgi:hypothetical protein
MTKIKLVEAPEWHYVDQGDEEPLYEPDITDVDAECALCERGIGWTEHLAEGPYGEEREGHRWVEYYEITAEYPDGASEQDPTKLCEDCAGWVGQVGPDVAAYDAAWQAAHTWSADQARLLREQPERANQPGRLDTPWGITDRGLGR